MPLDQEITNEGDYYQDPSLPDDQITYLYTALPVDQSLPSNIDAQLVQQLYLYSDADGDYYDGEEDHDPWDPTNPPCIGYSPTGIPYETICDGDDPHCPGCSLRTAATSKRVNHIKEATAYLKSIGINPKDLFVEAMKISGNPDELVADDATTRKNPTNSTTERRYRPGGHLTVRDNSANTDVDLKDVTIKTRRFFNLHTTKTNSTGHFSIPGTYNKKATVLIKFKNDYATIRGINGLLKIWQYVFPIKRNLGTFERTAMENITATFNTDFVSNSNMTMQWVAATTMNNVWQMRNLCNANNIQNPPANLKIWVSSAVTSDAGTPMLSHVTDHNLIRQVLEQYLAGWSNVLDLTSIMQSLVPDITLRYGHGHGTPMSSREINNNIFHEQAHSIHYIFVGPIYWTQEIAYTLAHLGYGHKTDAGAGRTAVVEAWGFFIGNVFNSQYYLSLSQPGIASDELQQLDNQVPDDGIAFEPSAASSRGWIPAGLLYDLTDSGVENTSFTTVTDNVFAYSIQNVFFGYAFGSAANIQDFKTNLLIYNNNLQAVPVNQLVTSYHY